MFHGDALGLFLGAIGLGAVHGVEPGHGWPVAASYALDQTNKWLYGFAAGFIIGFGHLVSSIAMVAVFFYAKGYFELTQIDEPLTVLGGLQIGGPVSIVAGLLLIGLGVREYLHGHGHSHGHSHGSGHGHSHVADRGHSHDSATTQGSEDGSVVDIGRTQAHDISDEQVRSIGTVGESGADHDHGHGADHDHGHDGPDTDRGLYGIAWFAFVLGFAHEEEFEIIALCAGSEYCLELMVAYAVTVILGIVGFTMLLIAGYQHYEAKVLRYTPYLPVFSAAVLVTMGVGFVLGLF